MFLEVVVHCFAAVVGVKSFVQYMISHVNSCQGVHKLVQAESYFLEKPHFLLFPREEKFSLCAKE